jgi:hypothetical protein
VDHFTNYPYFLDSASKRVGFYCSIWISSHLS